MPETSAPVVASETKQCKVCGEAIKVVARKCIHCDSYQDWHADVSISSTVLALIVALVTALTAALPVLQRTLTANNSELSFSFQAATKEIISVLVTNQGVRPGSVVNHGSLSITPKDGKKVPYELALSNTKDAGAILIEPGTSVILNYQLDPLSKPPNPQVLDDDLSCTLRLPYNEFKTTTGLVEKLSPACHEFKFWVANPSPPKT